MNQSLWGLLITTFCYGIITGIWGISTGFHPLGGVNGFLIWGISVLSFGAGGAIYYLMKDKTMKSKKPNNE